MVISTQISVEDFKISTRFHEIPARGATDIQIVYTPSADHFGLVEAVLVTKHTHI